MSKVLWEWIPNVGSEAEEMRKPWVLHLYCWILLDTRQKKSIVYETECRHVAVQKGKQDQNHL